ncbi:MAG: type II toxin-antitoxin system RelE/ParE family toxin [Burkholderiales bacterium]|nr:type II toxin-antitoxin system RelE/ParE family toxin [Burkholderiales bacterium]
MSFKVRYTRAAREDLKRLFAFQLERDRKTALCAREAIEKSVEFLREFPFSCRKSESGNPFLRELVIPFGATGHVALFEIEDNDTITILAIRHQLEDDFH